MSRRSGTSRQRHTATAGVRRAKAEPIIPLLLALTGAIAWFQAGWLLSHYEFHVHPYDVAPTNGGSYAGLGVLIAIGGLLGWGAWRVARADNRDAGPARYAPALWLLASAVIPLADALRLAGVPLAHTFLEPLWLAFVSGMAAWRTVLSFPGRRNVPDWIAGVHPWPVLVVLGTVLFGIWCYSESVEAHSNYLLGFADFGDHARRVVDTWEGRGLLTRSPQWAPFFDHFDGGLVVLAPLWGLWPDARLFFAVQAVCLALPAVCLYGAARRLGGSKPAAAAWAGGYLAFPAVGQLNLNFSYGWHDVSMALPLVAASFWAHLAGRRWLALGLAAFACTFKEEVFVFLSGLAAGMLVLETLELRRIRGSGEAVPAKGASGLSGLRPWQWLAVSAAFALGFFVVSRSFGLMENPTVWKFQNLGSTAGEIALSPLLRPREFWGQVFQPDSICYLSALLIPAGLPLVLRGWPVLIALAAPWMVLLGWQFEAARSIAFQYVTIQIPVLFLASMVGAVRSRRVRVDAGRLLPGGIMVLVAGIVASVYIGALPFSGDTIPFTRSAEEQEKWAPFTAAMDRAVEMVDDPGASVIASGRLAAHLLGVARLEMVGFALEALDGLAKEAGPGRSWIEVFDWVAVDLNDRRLHHSIDELKTVVMAAEAADYVLVMADHGILVYRRPGTARAAPANPLAEWRPSQAEIDRAVRRGDAVLQMPALRGWLVRCEAARSDASDPWLLEGELILQATTDVPSEYLFRVLLREKGETVVETTAPFVPVGGNRPTSWWKAGESWLQEFTLQVPPEWDPALVMIQLHAEPRLDW